MCAVCVGVGVVVWMVLRGTGKVCVAAVAVVFGGGVWVWVCVVEGG